MKERKYDVAIIGAGVIGCSLAYYLTTRGINNVILIEKEEFPGTGSTSKANGGIRAQFTTEPHVQMSLLSMRLLEEMDEEMQSQARYVKAGYLFVTARSENFKKLKELVQFQQRLGVAVELLDKSQIEAGYTYLRTDDLVGGSYGKQDGFIDPGGLTYAYYSRALARGVQFLANTRATGLLSKENRVYGVKTDKGDVLAELIVNAAGPYAAVVANWANVSLPLEPVRRNIGVTGPTPDFPNPIPMTIDLDTGLVIRREGEGCSMAWADPDEPPGFNLQFDPNFIEKIAPKMEKRFPKLMEAGINFSKCWAGLYPETPDHHAILGESGVSGFLLATGLGGHGVMHAPAVGFTLSEFIATGQSTTLDLAPFTLQRFKTGKLNIERAVL